jgi:hypothetical protein
MQPFESANPVTAVDGWQGKHSNPPGGELIASPTVEGRCRHLPRDAPLYADAKDQHVFSEDHFNGLPGPDFGRLPKLVPA